jgi:hypothetical protein
MIHYINKAIRKNKMTYSELIQKLQVIEKQTGLDLSDMCVDAENAVDPTSDKSACESGGVTMLVNNAEEAGLDIKKIALDCTIY